MSLELPRAEVIPTKVYLDSLANYKRTFPKLEEIHKGIVWTLERDPFWGKELPNMPDHRTLETYPASSETIFHVLFKYDATSNKVYLLSICSSGIII